MTATATTTIQGVSVLSRQKNRAADRFELALSPTGIEVRRPGRPVQQLGWDRVSEWEIEERKGYLLLTLRGRGATTPLVVPGWSLDDLELLMREITADAAGLHNGAGPVVTKSNGAAAAAAASAAPKTMLPVAQPAPAPAPAAAAPPSRAERRQQAPRPPRKRRQFQLGWKPVVTMVLLAVLAGAITLVLLQSAGVINWSFLGPVA
ncbi:MAG TPA: hypothetical protein VIY26_03745 [Acidimicrobiales bacterium]